MTELTQEQIAQGWIAYAGQSFDPETLVQIYTPSGGTEMGLAGDFDFEQPTADSYEEDPIGSAIDFITMYRILEPVRPSLPSPPVSGEAVTDPDSIFYGASIEEAIETGTWFWQLGRGPMSVSQGGFASFDDAKADLRRLLTGSTEKTRLVNKEWFERMVKLEDGCEISAGTLSPLTNEPVGVTLPADLARCLLVENNQHEKHLLQWTEGRATNKLDEYINLLKQSRDRLSAAIGERG